MASYSADFLKNPFEPCYKSPVRPDPRPLWGILLAVHAFLPVAVMHRRLRADSHPIVRSFEPGERWVYCFIDDEVVGEI